MFEHAGSMQWRAIDTTRDSLWGLRRGAPETTSG
jgi:hypothetical protein